VDPIILVLLVILVAVVAGVGFLLIARRRDNATADALGANVRQGRGLYQEREVYFEKAPESLEEIELAESFGDRVVGPLMTSLGQFVVRLTPQRQIEAIRALLEQAGDTTEPSAFFVKRIFITIVFGILGLVVSFVLLKLEFNLALAITLGAVLLGYFLPVLALKGKITKRQDEIQRSLPDALDLLTICVEAGLGFDQAMGKVYTKWDNELATAFGRVLREVQLGSNRRDALRRMADRINLPDLNSFVAAVIQSEQLGVSMGKILRVQSDQMRVKRRQRAQEKAHQAPVKMMFPMILLIFPSLWIVLMGPALILLFQTATSGAV
jgi:tight adherence protein C